MEKRLPTMAEEAAALTERMGYYVPPYKLAAMLKTASKVLNIITDSRTQCTYADCKVSLSLVEDALRRGCGDGENTWS